jgi:hypothetical protein
MTMSMTLPYREPLVPREPAERVIPEPPRRGEPGGPSCAICTGGSTNAVWSDDNWTLHAPIGGSLPGTVWLASREHWPPTSAGWRRGSSGRSSPWAASRGCISIAGGTEARISRVWFLPRPFGMVEASGMMLPLWEDVLPNVSDPELEAAARRVADAM